MLKRATHTVPFLLSIILTLSHPASGSSLDDGKAGDVINKVRSLQVPFIENRGQVGDESKGQGTRDGRVKFYAKTFGGTIFITADGNIIYSLPALTGRGEPCVRPYSENGNQTCEAVGALLAAPYSPPEYEAPGQAVGARRAVPLQDMTAPAGVGAYGHTPLQERKSEEKGGWVIREAFVGATISEVTGEDPAATSVSYFKGNDPAKWKSSLSTYNAVSLGEIYDGIELKLKAYGNNMEKLFHVKPGADPAIIKIRLAERPAAGGIGATGGRPPGLSVNDKGELEIETDLGVVKFTKPVAYQEEEAERPATGRIGAHGGRPESGANIRKYVEVSYAVEGDGYTFKVGEYDRGKELLIDPLLASTFLGGSDGDPAYSITLDSSGNVYVAGWTWSSDFPTTAGAYDTSLSGSEDAFVSKFDGSLTNLLASTFLGGSITFSLAFSIAVDSTGNVYVAGRTASPYFPTTARAYDATFNGYSDAFVSKFDGSLTNLLASTFLGGSSSDSAGPLALDSSGSIYVAGSTDSSDFPTAAGAHDNAFNGGSSDAFVSKLDGGLRLS